MAKSPKNTSTKGRPKKLSSARTGHGKKATIRSRAVSPADPFRHVVLLMLENRSFDHMLGALQPVVTGLDGVPSGGTPRTNPDLSGAPVAQLPVAAFIVEPDPKHETPNVLDQLKDKNGRFVKDYERNHPGLSSAKKQAVMAYHRLGTLGPLHTLGRAFAVCDRWFCSVPGPTWTNRLFAMSGTSLGRVKMPEGIFHPNLHRYSQASVFRQIEKARRSLRIYFGDFPLALILADRRRRRAALKFRPLARFFADAAGKESSFPDFAFIEPRYMLDPNDDHPPHNIGAGERLIGEVYEAIRANRALWESTLLVVAYDEHGGFYDHVAPPAATPPDANHQEYTFDRLGVRVPVLLISPWIEPQVVHKVADHTALLRSLQVRWGLGSMGRRVALAPDILASVRLAKTPSQEVPKLARPPATMRATRPLRKSIAPAQLSDHQRAIVAFSAYLETQTVAPPAQKVRALTRAMKSPAEAGRVAVERASRYLAQSAARGRRRR